MTYRTVADGQAQFAFDEGHTARTVDEWTDEEWAAFQYRFNSSMGARTDDAYKVDISCRLALLTGEAVRVM